MTYDQRRRLKKLVHEFTNLLIEIIDEIPVTNSPMPQEKKLEPLSVDYPKTYTKSKLLKLD